MIFGFWQGHEIKAVTVATSMDYLGWLKLPDPPASSAPAADPAAALARFREDFYRCLSRRSDALFELTDAVLCSGTPVTSLVELSLTAEHRRGHGALYDALNAGVLDIGRLRTALAGLPLRRTTDGHPAASRVGSANLAATRGSAAVRRAGCAVGDRGAPG